MISIRFQGKIFNIRVIKAYASNNNEEVEVECFCEVLQDFIELTPKKKKRCHFIIGDWNAKAGSQEITWSKRQICPWHIKQSRTKANRVLPREHTGHSKHPLPTTQEKTLHMDITNGQYQNQIDYILCRQRWSSSIQSTKQDQELTVAQIMNSLLPNSDLN